jgi:hypothetical protein
MVVRLKGQPLLSLLFFALGCAFSGVTQGVELTPIFRMSSSTYSEPVSISGAFHEWSGDFHGGKRQWSSNWIEAGFKYESLGISTIARYDIDLRFSRATADFYHSLSRKLPLDQGRTYDLDLRIRSFNASGVRFSWISAWYEPGLKLETGISLMKARNLQDGSIKGLATPSSNKDYDYQVNAEYHYDADRLFNRPNVVEPEGRSITIDLRGEMVLAPRWHFDFEVRDLIGLVWWKDTPYTRAAASSGVKTYDSNGYVSSISANINGREGYEKFTQRLLPAIDSKLYAPLLPKINGMALYRRQFKMNLWGLGAETSGNDVNWGARYWPEISSLGIEIQWPHLITSLTFDNTNINDIRAAWFNIEYR